MTENLLYFDMDRRILLNSHDISQPIPDADIPWFSTRYPIKVTLQAISRGEPAIVGQQPIRVILRRGNTEYCCLFAISGANPWFVVPSLAVTQGPLSVELRDGLDNVILQFYTTCVDAVPENPSYIPTVFSNPTSVRVSDEGERIIRQPYNRLIRLQRDASLFLVEDLPESIGIWTVNLDFGSLCLDHYYSCNRLLVKVHNETQIVCETASPSPSILNPGWREGRVTVHPDSTTVINFN